MAELGRIDEALRQRIRQRERIKRRECERERGRVSKWVRDPKREFD